MVLGQFIPQHPLVNVVVLVVATGLVFVGSDWLETSAEHLSGYYGLPPVIQGSVVVAVGSSFPEFASVVLSGLAGAFDLGVGAIVGSAIFNVLVIPALSSVFSDADLKSNREVVYKEAQFYMLAVSVFVVTTALAVIYVPIDGGSRLSGWLTRPLSVIPLGLYGLYLFIQWQDVSDNREGHVPDEIDLAREWATLAGGLAVILLAVELLVGATTHLSTALGVPEFLAGVTILAAATSLPDTIVSIRTAQQDRDTTSLGNVLGSNTFDLLVAIPIGVLIVGAVPVDFAVVTPMMAVLTLATILLFGFLRTEMRVTGREAWALLGSYALFVAWVVAEVVGLTGLIKGV